MNADLKQTCEDAFDVIAETVGVDAVITGSRLETGAATARSLCMGVRAIVSEEQFAEMPSDAMSPTPARVRVVKIGRINWVDHKPPQTGDVLTFDDYPQMRVQSVATKSYGWSLVCDSLGAT